MATIDGDSAILVGTDLADFLIERDPPFPGQKLVGLQGDDTYLLQSLDSIVMEDAGVGTGTDTIRLAVYLVPGVGQIAFGLPYQVENFEVLSDPQSSEESTRNLSIVGNELQNRITGAAENTIDKKQ